MNSIIVLLIFCQSSPWVRSTTGGSTVWCGALPRLPRLPRLPVSDSRPVTFGKSWVPPNTTWRVAALPGFILGFSDTGRRPHKDETSAQSVYFQTLDHKCNRALEDVRAASYVYNHMCANKWVEVTCVPVQGAQQKSAQLSFRQVAPCIRLYLADHEWWRISSCPS